jgi:hypothetical protein
MVDNLPLLIVEDEEVHEVVSQPEPKKARVSNPSGVPQYVMFRMGEIRLAPHAWLELPSEDLTDETALAEREGRVIIHHL